MKNLLSILLLLFTPSMAFAFDDQAIVEKCDVEWGTDFQMVKYCRQQQRQAGAKADGIREAAKSNSTVQAVLKHCEEEWGKDYEMLVYCHDQQVAAHSSLSNKPADVPQNTFDLIERECAGKWSTDFVMVAYCIEQQAAAWKEIQ